VDVLNPLERQGSTENMVSSSIDPEYLHSFTFVHPPDRREANDAQVVDQCALSVPILRVRRSADGDVFISPLACYFLPAAKSRQSLAIAL
jgi:hypothetical protein